WVREGQPVGAGQQVAEVGASGAGATGAHLDYRIRDAAGRYHDPTPLLGPLARLPRADGLRPPVGSGQVGLPGGVDFSFLFGGAPSRVVRQKGSGGWGIAVVVPRGTTVCAPFDGVVQVMRVMNGRVPGAVVILTDPRTGFSMRLVHTQPLAQGPVRRG